MLPHWFLLSSRLGLLHAPYGSQDANQGVEEGPQAVFSFEMLMNEPLARFTTFHFPQPEEVTTDTYFATLTDTSRACLRSLDQWVENETLITLGGDHSVGFVSLQKVVERFSPEKVGVLMVDSHADLHQPSSSPSGNFHGMWLRPFFDTFENPEIDAFVPKKLSPDHLCYLGNLLLEPAEEAFLRDHEVLHVEDGSDLACQQFLQRFEHVHVSFDMDVFASPLVPAVGNPNPNGLTWQSVVPVLERLRQLPSWSFDLVEVNPRKPGASETIALAQKVLVTVLGQERLQ